MNAGNTQNCYLTRNVERMRQRTIQTEQSVRDTMRHAQLLRVCAVRCTEDPELLQPSPMKNLIDELLEGF